jgi:phage terminase large subunit GpA-like protein
MRDERAFFAEYQNEPLAEVDARPDDLTADQIAARINRMPANAVGLRCNRLTAFIDVQASLLYWMICAWEDDFSGAIVNYGAFPDQRAHYFTLANATNTLERAIPGAGLEGRIYAGLERLVGLMMGREYPRDDGAAMRIDRIAIDANWSASTAVVYKFCRQSAHAAALMPSHGKYVGAAGLPMSEWQNKPGDRLGYNWRIRVMREERGVRALLFDTNFWKSFVMARLGSAMGDPGSMSIFGAEASSHRLLADHCVSEFRIETQGRGRTVDEWKIRPERFDNHFFDCLVGCTVAANVLGVTLGQAAGMPAAPARAAPVRFSSMQRARAPR